MSAVPTIRNGDPRGLSFTLEEAAARLGKHPQPDPEQLDLLPKSAEDRRLAEEVANLHPAQIPAVMARFRAIRPLVNHDFEALGFRTKREYIGDIAREVRVSWRTVRRWLDSYLQDGLGGLANERPGPLATGYGSAALDASQRAQILDDWLKGRTKAQCYARLVGYLKEKQQGCGPAWVYSFPSRRTVSRYIKSLGPTAQAHRCGPEALKAAAGHCDRTFLGLGSLGLVECDEWNTNALAFDLRRCDLVRRFWLVTIYDTRSIYPLVWDLVGAVDGAKKLHGISQHDEQRLFVRLTTEFGIPRRFYSDRGRFRGSFWGGGPGARARRRDAEFARSDGIFDSLGVERRTPREHNPRGSRLERFHLFLSEKCRGLPGWIGANDQERKMTPGDRHAAEHMDFVAGRRLSTPLLSKEQLLEHINAWMEEWRTHPSTGTDMNGLSPRAVFLRETPPEGFRKPDDAERRLLSAEWYPNRMISAGGIVELPDGSRYGLPGELKELQGFKRHIVRMPDDRSLIIVKALRKGQPDVIAHLRPRLGIDDPGLGAWMESQQRVRRDMEARYERPSPASNTAEILQPHRAELPARRQPRFAGDIARDAEKMEAGE